MKHSGCWLPNGNVQANFIVRVFRSLHVHVHINWKTSLISFFLDNLSEYISLNYWVSMCLNLYLCSNLPRIILLDTNQNTLRNVCITRLRSHLLLIVIQLQKIRKKYNKIVRITEGIKRLIMQMFLTNHMIK